jgi:hypothetical protein
MSEITKFEISKKLQVLQFNRSTMNSKFLIAILKGNVNLRADKKELLQYGHGINANHV